MRLIKNTGNDRVIDELRQALAPQSSLDLASPAFSLFAFAELREVLEKLDTCRVVIPQGSGTDLGLTGSDNDRAFRNRLQVRWLARECAAWIRTKVELRAAPVLLPQSILIAGKPDSELQRVITGNCPFTTEGLGLTPGDEDQSHAAEGGQQAVCDSPDNPDISDDPDAPSRPPCRQSAPPTGLHDPVGPPG